MSRRTKSVAFESSRHFDHDQGDACSIDENTTLLRRNDYYSYTQSAPSSPIFLSHASSVIRRARSNISIGTRAETIVGHQHSALDPNRTWYNNFTTIDWLREGVRTARDQSSLSLGGFQGWLCCFFVSLLTATVGYAIMLCEDWLFSIKSGRCSSGWWKSHDRCQRDFMPWSHKLLTAFTIHTVLACAFALLAALLTMTTLTVFPSGKRLYMAAGSGIPEVKVILSGFVIHGFLGINTLFVKVVGLTLAVASGMNLGKEGPLVHIASCIANIVSRCFPQINISEVRRRKTISAACAAGVSTAFGAPIGGVLFALEEASTFFSQKTMWRSFFSAAVAAGLLRTFNPHGTGKIMLLETTFDRPWRFNEIPIFVLLGALGGIFGGVFCIANIAWSRHVRSSRIVSSHPIFEVLVVCLLSSSLSYWNLWTRMSGIHMVNELLTRCSTKHLEDYSHLCPRPDADTSGIILSLTSAMLLKVLLTTVTFGLKLPAGIFVPCLSIGALYGRVIGLLLQSKWSLPLEPGVYAMLGAAAALAGVTRMTVSLVVIMLELTNSLHHAVPLMVTVLVAKWIADVIERRSIYELLIELNDWPFLSSHNATIGHSIDDLLPSPQSTYAATVDVTEVATVSKGVLLDKIAVVRKEGFGDGSLAVVKHGRLIGSVSLADLALSLDLLAAMSNDVPLLIDPFVGKLGDLTTEEFPRLKTPDTAETTSLTNLTPIVDCAPLSLARTTPLDMVNDLFAKLGLRQLAIHDDDGRYIGSIHRKRLVRAMRK
ncbi:hypothetical protein PYCC9005_005954 [Savitreella phatthalungensis]